MPRGIVRECYWGSFSTDPECGGRRRLIHFDGEKEKQWICKRCYDFLSDYWYCDGGFKLCAEECLNRDCRGAFKQQWI